MKFLLEQATQVLCTNSNPRTELHGEERVRAIDLAFLRKHGASTVEQIAAGLGIPEWAVRPALDSAEVAGLAEPTADGVRAIQQQKVAA